jgi:hypothetical protein
LPCYKEDFSIELFRTKKVYICICRLCEISWQGRRVVSRTFEADPIGLEQDIIAIRQLLAEDENEKIDSICRS